MAILPLLLRNTCSYHVPGEFFFPSELPNIKKRKAAIKIILILEVLVQKHLQNLMEPLPVKKADMKGPVQMQLFAPI